MAWHAIAHGADAILYWQWRSALGGQEQYHGSLVDQSGQPRPFYEEAHLLGEQIRSVSSLLEGSTVKSRVAMLNSYDSRWSIEFQRHHSDFTISTISPILSPLAAITSVWMSSSR
jgi:beta-galactosidase